MKNRALKVIHILLFSALAALFVALAIFGAVSSPVAHAAESEEVLRDLRRDKNFNEEEYKHIPESTSISVITVAEGEGDQLFIYVYNPSMNALFNATYIRLSTAIGENYAPEDYGLTLVSTSGVFQKYYVKNLVLKQYSQRFYDIPCIFRKFVKDIDNDCVTESKNNVEQVVFEVGMCFTATTLNGEVSYTCEGTEVVTITDKYVFNGKYPDGFEWYGVYLNEHKTVAHIIAFSTDWDIQQLYEIDIEYLPVSYTHTWSESSANGYKPFNEEFVLGNESEFVKKVIIAQDENGNDITVSNPGVDSGWMFGHTYTWKRVQTANSFIKLLNDNKIKLFDDVSTSLIENKQWVVAFAETEYSKTEIGYPFLDSTVTDCTEKGFKVENVSVMRLKFKCAKGVKNLGVVDNYQSGSLDSVFEGKNDLEIFTDEFNKFWEMFIKVIFVVIGVILLVLLLNFVSPVMSVFKFIVKAIIYVVTLPFKLIKKLFKKDG